MVAKFFVETSFYNNAWVLIPDAFYMFNDHHWAWSHDRQLVNNALGVGSLSPL